PAREQPLLAARFRKKSRRLMSIGAVDIGGTVSLKAQHLTRPSEIAANLSGINCFFGFADKRVESLFDSDNMTPQLKKIGELLNTAKKTRHIILGDSACEAENFGEILQQAEILAKNTDASLGVLSSGANGAGARRFGMFPEKDGMNTADMLNADLAAVIMFGCEPQDFSAPEAARAMLVRAGFVCAITPFTGGMQSANVILPAAAFGENEGAFINGEGREQDFSAAVAPPGEARMGWKILRVLGEMLGIGGFDFSTLEDVRRMMKNEPPPDAPPLSAPPDMPDAGEFELAGGAALYDLDMAVRRAPALQATAQGKNAAHAFFHPDDMARCNIAEGGEVCLGDGEKIWQTRAFADSRLAHGVILAYPPNLRRAGISAEPVKLEAAG
ncbi:MAG: molybdopterin-dependent oxidoreductase, partial [Betaproteobacteria bacterium]|nr:molybdopterin-dependent oxidoreductase [Betaproteobacteria bacterium]